MLDSEKLMDATVIPDKFKVKPRRKDYYDYPPNHDFNLIFFDNDMLIFHQQWLGTISNTQIITVKDFLEKYATETDSLFFVSEIFDEYDTSTMSPKMRDFWRNMHSRSINNFSVSVEDLNKEPNND